MSLDTSVPKSTQFYGIRNGITKTQFCDWGAKCCIELCVLCECVCVCVYKMCMLVANIYIYTVLFFLQSCIWKPVVWK